MKTVTTIMDKFKVLKKPGVGFAHSFWMSKPSEDRQHKGAISPEPRWFLKPTYQLDSFDKFRYDPVYKIMEEVVTTALEEQKYDPTVVPQLCLQMSADIRTKVKALNFDRYKYVVLVTIIENKSQSIRSSCGYLWDHTRDDYVVYRYERPSMFCVATCFAIYFD